jgi:hypothetical protein
MFSMIVLQLLELQIPSFLLRLVPDREFKTNLEQLLFSFRIHSAIFEQVTLPLDPTAQLWVKAVVVRHFKCNSRRYR